VTGWRVALAIAAAVLACVSGANLLLWHAHVWVPIGILALLVLVAAVFEVGRYRPATDPSANWVATGERFLDPTTGTDTTVSYDPVSGTRDYRPS
jgi:hypothetical protein